GDLQDIAVKYHARNPETDTDRKIKEEKKYFCVSRAEIEAEVYDFSLSCYKEDVFEEVKYEAPAVILDKLIEAEVGDTEMEDLTAVQGGIVCELLELREMIG
nr:SAM-dependent DNA methyltransferase [Desulfobulbaceae bacterium]